MADIIQLLTDSVANQIAAGEVVQRPASVVKELMENSVDSGANEIKVIIKDAGKTLIQVIDNGCGMSETDARLAFERHATSKITKTDDLFSLQTFGFRGEALASIAAIAQVELRTRTKENELGTIIEIHASEVKRQEPCSCPNGCNLSVRNIFYNVPARRKFLKSDAIEFKNLISEFERVVLAHPEIAFELIHNTNSIYKLPVSNIKQRITYLEKKFAGELIRVNVDTTLLKLSGYIGHPEIAKKNCTEEFFFVNNRYMKHPYFHKAVLLAYENLLPSDFQPVYYLYLEVDPQTIDINIHPTKTEIKFENAPALFQIIRAAVKESLGKFNVVPSIDFDMENADHIPILRSNTEVKIPTIEVDKNYNPFREGEKTANYQYSNSKNNKIPSDWEKFYQDFENNPEPDVLDLSPQQQEISYKQNTEHDYRNFSRNFIQLKNKYILTTVKSGLMIIDQKRAHERILFEKYLKTYNEITGTSQHSLFPETLECNAADFVLIQEISEGLNFLGFDISEFGHNTFILNGSPATESNKSPKELLLEILDFYKNTSGNIFTEYKLKITLSLAKASAIPYGKQLSIIEMQDITDQLFACPTPNYTPDNKLIVTIISEDEIAKKL